MKKAKNWLEANQIEFVECLVPDVNGLAKGKTVPTKELFDGVIRLPEAIFGQDIMGEWCHDFDLMDVADVDMVLLPDVSTLVSQPWSNTNTAQCICDCQSKDGSVLDIAPRSVLKKVIGLFADLGMQPVVAQEAEFYLVAKNPDPRLPLTAAVGVSGRQQRTPRSFQMEALSEYSPFLESLYGFAKAQNIDIAGVVQEMGPGQLEVNFNHGDPLTKADEMFNFKRIARQAALECGYHATFLAKPISHKPGSAMHLHQSLVDQKNGTNVFVNEDGSHSDNFWAYLGGLQKYTPDSIAFFAPNVNSYRRFEIEESCPTNTQWGFDNRTTGFRVPVAEPNATRVENRIPGSDTNPYLAIAVNLACGYLGLRDKLKPSDPVTENAWELPHTIPLSLMEALARLEACQPLMEILGERFVKLYVEIRRRDAIAFAGEVTAWEREHLLLTV